MGRRLSPILESPVDLFGDAVNGGNRPTCLLFPLFSASDRSGDGRSSSSSFCPPSFSLFLFSSPQSPFLRRLARPPFSAH